MLGPGAVPVCLQGWTYVFTFTAGAAAQRPRELNIRWAGSGYYRGNERKGGRQGWDRNSGTVQLLVVTLRRVDQGEDCAGGWRERVLTRKLGNIGRGFRERHL